MPQFCCSIVATCPPAFLSFCYFLCFCFLFFFFFFVSLKTTEGHSETTKLHSAVPKALCTTRKNRTNKTQVRFWFAQKSETIGNWTSDQGLRNFGLFARPLGYPCCEYRRYSQHRLFHFWNRFPLGIVACFLLFLFKCHLENTIQVALLWRCVEVTQKRSLGGSNSRPWG